jgi:peroxiredoxin
MKTNFISGKHALTRLLAACAATVAVTGATVATAQNNAQPDRGERTGARVGERAPDFTLTDLDGKTHTLSQILDGKTTVVLEWFNPDCPFVKKHYGTQTNDAGEKVFTMNALRTKYADKGVVFIGVCHPRGVEKMADTATEHGIKFPIAADTSGSTIEAFKVDSYPDYYIIDRQGNLFVADASNRAVEEILDAMLNENAS